MEKIYFRYGSEFNIQFFEDDKGDELIVANEESLLAYFPEDIFDKNYEVHLEDCIKYNDQNNNINYENLNVTRDFLQKILTENKLSDYRVVRCRAEKQKGRLIPLEEQYISE